MKSAENSGYADSESKSVVEFKDLLNISVEAEIEDEDYISEPFLNNISAINNNVVEDIYPEDSDEENDDCLKDPITKTIPSSTPSENLKDNALCYYAGFAAFKLNKILDCALCKNYLIDSSNSYKSSHTLISLKSYGTLTNPTDNFKILVEIIQAIFDKKFTQCQFENNLCKNLIQYFEHMKLPLQSSCSNAEHKIKILKFIIIGLIRFTLRNTNNSLHVPKTKYPKC